MYHQGFFSSVPTTHCCSCPPQEKKQSSGFPFEPFWKTSYYPDSLEVRERFWQKHPSQNPTESTQVINQPRW